MKKLVLAIVSILLMALFIAFNYLLWDREKREHDLKVLEVENASNNANLSLLNREIKNLEEENNTLQVKINQLQSEQEMLTKSSDALAQEKERLTRELSLKKDMLNILKGICDIKVFEEPVKKWVEAINAGEYDKAYEYEYASLNSAGNPPDLATYSENLKNTVKSIGLKSVKVDPARGTNEGDIVLDAELEVRLADKDNAKGYREGINKRYIKLGYDFTKKEFTILLISEY